MRKLLQVVGKIHGLTVSGTRKLEIAKLLTEQIPESASVLDVGCGDGQIASLVARNGRDLKISGIEVSARSSCAVECTLFDGVAIPFADNSFDVCMLVDVLHHTNSPQDLLREAARVSRMFVLIKEHLCENQWDHFVLRAMDWVGNRPIDVAMTYNYKSRSEWASIFADCDLKIVNWDESVKLHAFPLNLLFSRNLHVIACLVKR